jgi:CheY-like chemotaxis protein
LVIEDVPAVLLSIRIILAGVGHKVTCAKNGIAGLRLLRETSYDIVVSDIWMPGLNGVEIIKQGRASSPNTRFLAITGGNPNGSDRLLASAPTKFGADAILLKPFEKSELVGAVAGLLAQTQALQ